MNAQDNIKQAIAIIESNSRDWETLEVLWKEICEQYPHVSFKGNIGTYVGPGWWHHLNVCFTQLNELMAQHPNYVFRVVQIKEKFGGLRFYYSVLRRGIDENDDEEVMLEDDEQTEVFNQAHGFIEAAEVACSTTCETCGEPGKLRTGGWLKTTCDRHVK